MCMSREKGELRTKLEPHGNLDRLMIERARAWWPPLMPQRRNSTIHRRENRTAPRVSHGACLCDRTLIFHADVAESSPVARDKPGLSIEGSHSRASRSRAPSMAARARFCRSISVGRDKRIVDRACSRWSRENGGPFREAALVFIYF